MINENITCPHCGSSDVIFSKKRQLFICEECEHTFQPVPQRVSRRVFMSYGRDEHASLALRLKEDLIARGHQVWLDVDRLKLGGDWEHYIEEGLHWVCADRDGRVILLMTPHSVRRPDGYCLNEIARALTRQLSVVPVMVVWAEPPLSICRIQWLDMQDCVPIERRLERYEPKLERLAQAVEEDLTDFEGAQSRLLHLLEPLPFDAEISQQLLRFTGRQWVFDRIDAWLADPNASRVFWIRGEPGTGKTAIAAWLCYHRREVAAFHLCRHGHVQKSDPRKCILSIAYQLSSQLPDYQTRLNALKLEQIIPTANALTLFDTLIVQPLSGNFPRPDRTLVILIDGLDEATRRDPNQPELAKNDLASFIASEFSRTPSWLRLIITSRPDPEVTYPLQGLEPYPLETASPENEADIRTYLQRELNPHVPDGHVPPPVIDTILARSEGVFLYVHWICQELTQGRLSVDRLHEFPRGLGEVYVQFFERQFPNIAAYEARIGPALDVVAAAQEPFELEMLAGMFGWGEREERSFCRTLGSLFEVMDGRIRPYHRTVLDWLTDAGRSGPYFVSVREGHKRLSQFGWQEYEKGVFDLSRYLLTHLPTHLARAERWDDLGTLLNDGDFLSALEGSSYIRWHRFESPEWQELLAAWIRHLLRQRGKEKAGAAAAIANVYFNAFWWWGEYISFPLCEQLVALLNEACGKGASDPFLDALRQFDASYPRRRDYHAGGADSKRWQRTKTALETIRAALGCDVEVVELRDNPSLLHLRAITDIYLAEALHALGSGPAGGLSAEALYEEAGEIVRNIENDAWIESWVLCRLGELWFDRGEPQKAMRQCREALKKAEETDYEIKADIYRVMGDVQWKEQQRDWAWAAYKLALFSAFRFQGEPQPADLYTIAFYGEMTDRILEKLREIGNSNDTVVDEACRSLHEFWSCYWIHNGGEAPLLDDATLHTWLVEKRDTELRQYLFPPAPREGDREYAAIAGLVSKKMVKQIAALEKSLVHA